MSKLRRSVRAYVIGVIAVAVALMAAIAVAFPRVPTPEEGLMALILFVSATLANVHVVHVGTKRKVTIDDTPVLAAVLTLSPLVAAPLAGAAKLLGASLATKTPLYNRIFNAATWVIAAGVAAVTFRLSTDPAAPLMDRPLQISIAAGLCFLVKTGLVDIVVGLQLRRDPLASWWKAHRSDLPHHLALAALGILAAFAAESHVWLLPLLLAPMGLVLLSLRESVRIRARTKQTLFELADLIDGRDSYTYRHSQRVAQYAERLARRLRFQPAQIDLVTEAARLHDFGKITTPDQVLRKPGPLDDDEWRIMRQHCDQGYKLLRGIPDFFEGAELVRCHHERVDGTGYPRGIVGFDLPVEASVIGVCDAYDAMTSDRVYRKALPLEKVRAELLAGRGRQWNERVADVMIAMIEEERETAAQRAFGPAVATLAAD